MTCIAAIADGKKVYMAADSAGVGGLSLSNRKDPKIYIVKDFMFGFTSSFRMGQLLGHSFKPPARHPDIPLETYMITTFVDALRDCLKAGGYVTTESGRDSGGVFLVGHMGRLFCLQEDFQVEELTDDFNAVGCGGQIALGALYASGAKDANTRLKIAMEAAQRFSAGVREPFIFETLG